MCTCIHINMYTCIHVHSYIHIYIYTNNIYIHMYMYIYIYLYNVRSTHFTTKNSQCICLVQNILVCLHVCYFNLGMPCQIFGCPQTFCLVAIFEVEREHLGNWNLKYIRICIHAYTSVYRYIHIYMYNHIYTYVYIYMNV